MRKLYFFLMLALCHSITNAQLVFNENFTGYTLGDLGTQGLWQQDGSGIDAQAASTNPLTYTGYGSGTKFINLASVNGTDPFKLFSAPITNITNTTRKVIFLSFVVRVSSAGTITASPDSSVSLFNTGSAITPLRFYIAQNIAGTGIHFGLQIGGNTLPQFSSGNFLFNTTYLIVIRYDVGSNNNTDDAYLWVNPTDYPSQPINPSQPGPGNTGASVINGATADFGGTINALRIIQSNSTQSPNASFDGFKVAYADNAIDAWTNLNPSQAALPVNLKSFKAIKDNNSVKVTWEVGIEDNLKGYEIQRSKDGITFEAIAYMDAAGKATYSFTDDKPLPGSNFYRVVTIDNDRHLKYSSIVGINGRKGVYLTKFPNPTTQTLIVQHQEVSSAGSTLRVTSLDGKAVKILRLALNSVQTNIDVSNLPAGNYALEFVNGGKKISTTFVKQ